MSIVQPRHLATIAGGTLFLLATLIGGCAEPAEEEMEAPEATEETDHAMAEDDAADADAEFEGALRELAAEWDRTLNAGDVDGALALYTSDPVAMPPDQPAAVGREAVRGVVESLVAPPGTELRNTVEDTRVDGDLGVGRGSYTVTTTPEGGEPTTVSGKWMAVSTRGADGSWKIATNIWNLDAPADGE